MGTSEADEIVGELYLVPPARFTAARDELVRKARAAGHRQLAHRLQGLRRPTMSAWLVNLLTRHEPEAMESLSALGRELRQAQVQLNGGALRLLSAQRKPMIYELVERARALATEAGMAPTDKALSEVEATLQAALVDLAASSTVMSGRLVRPMAHSGFGPMPAVDPPPAAVVDQLRDQGRDARASVPRRGEDPADVPRAAVSAPPPAGATSLPSVSAQPAPAVRAAPGAPSGADEADEADKVGETDVADRWMFWPVDGPTPESGAASPIEAVRLRSLEEARRRRQAPASPRQPAPKEDAVRRAEAALAAAESRHWQREHELADAAAALEAAGDRLRWLEQQRLEAKAAKATAERHVAEARSAQRSAVRALAEARRALHDAETRQHRPSADRRDD
jgi:hypothetical protein